MRWTAPLAVGLTALLRFAPGAAAQEETSRGLQDSTSAPRRFFDRPVDYWQRGLSYPAPEETEATGPGRDPQKSSGSRAGSDWTQAVRQPDGSWTVRELPRPLVQVLEDPSPEKVRAYFEWKWSRMEKILRAAEAMKTFRSSLPGSPAGEPEPAESPGDGSPRGPVLAPRGETLKDAARPQERSPEEVAITYFHRAGCPACDSQDAVLAAWLPKHPELKLEVLEFGVKPELWRTDGVRGTPSLVLRSRGGSAKVLLEGLSSERALEEALGRCRRTPPGTPHPKEGERS